MFDDAMQTARELDQYYEESGHVKGPLHGLPISLKDQFHVKGYDTTMGYVGWIGTHEGSSDPAKVHKVNSQVVEELLSLGAVLYCKVIVPTSIAGKILTWSVQTSLPQTLSVSRLSLKPGVHGTESRLHSQLGETINNIIGTTLNPVNQLLSCGGSSGGMSARTRSAKRTISYFLLETCIPDIRSRRSSASSSPWKLSRTRH